MICVIAPEQRPLSSLPVYVVLGGAVLSAVWDGSARWRLVSRAGIDTGRGPSNHIAAG